MKYGIFYIATSVYKNYFENFLNTSKYIFPDKFKQLIVLSDGLNEYNGTVVNKNTIITVENIIDYPYPLINLCKFQTIYHYAKKHNIDKILYFDADTIIFEKDNDFWKNVENLLNTDKLICSYHPHYLYNNDILTTYCFPHFNEDIACSIDESLIYKNRCYIMSSFFMGSINAIKYAADKIYEYSSKDLKNHRWIPTFSDETYLNALYIKDNIIENKNTIYLDKYITINPYSTFYNDFCITNRNNDDIWHNNFMEINSLFINQKYDIKLKEQKRG